MMVFEISAEGKIQFEMIKCVAKGFILMCKVSLESTCVDIRKHVGSGEPQMSYFLFAFRVKTVT